MFINMIIGYIINSYLNGKNNGNTNTIIIPMMSCNGNPTFT